MKRLLNTRLNTGALENDISELKCLSSLSFTPDKDQTAGKVWQQLEKLFDSSQDDLIPLPLNPFTAMMSFENDP